MGFELALGMEFDQASYLEHYFDKAFVVLHLPDYMDYLLVAKESLDFVKNQDLVASNKY